MKIIAAFFIIILLSSLVSAEYVPNDFRNSITSLDEFQVEDWLLNTFEYEYHRDTKPISWAWRNKKADCTEYANMAAYYFEKKGYEVIKERTMTSCGLHDYIYYSKDSNLWTKFDPLHCQ